MNKQDVFERLKKDCIKMYSEEGVKEKLSSGKTLKIKLGADPSRPDLHLGHSVVLRKLRLLQDLGHEIIFVIGDFTGMIGDPSGRSKTRIALTYEQTRINGQTYFEQVTKILDREKTKIVYNSEWLAKLNFAEVLSLTGKYTIAQIMERDDFSNRYNNNQPIGLHEFMYPLMQGYDSVALEADIEVGGTDQTFNLLVGRELQRLYGQEPQEVITFPLLAGLDGVEKMSKSLDNYIGIDENAEIMFEKCMKVPDNVLVDYFKLTTDIDENIYSSAIKSDIRAAHFIYAEEIVKMYHGQASVDNAKQRYLQIASGNLPINAEEFIIEEDSIDIISLLKMIGFANSNSEARRLIEGRGIKVDNVTISDINMILHENAVISKGKGKHARITINR